ncbi:MAG: PIN domain-containing protein, partial [Terrimicrobiaceae bacterium]
MIQTAHVFPDTNILLHYPALDGMNWLELCKAKAVTLHISHPLLHELNKAKEIGSTKAIRDRAKTVIRSLKNIRAGQAVLPKSVQLEFAATSPDIRKFEGLHPDVADDFMIGAVLSYRDENPDALVYFATADDALGLLIKCNNHNIRTVEIPETLRLAAEPDPETIELRKLRKEVETLRSSHPNVHIEFDGGIRILKFKPPNLDVEQALSDLMEKVRKDHPRLSVPAQRKNSIASLTMGHLFLTPEKVEIYNRQLEMFIPKMESALMERLSAKSHTIFFSIAANNIGRAPATDLQVDLHFPDGFLLRKQNEWDSFLNRGMHLTQPPPRCSVLE